ncbi:MAG: MarC family protein [Polyangiaceae bacterium]
MSVFAFAVLCFSSLFTVIDPIATTPVFASMTQGRPSREARSIALRACLVALGVLTVFAVGGAFVFKMFGITLDAFRIGGGVVFLTLGLPMLASHEDAHAAPSAAKDPAIVPLGVPLIAGPGAITTVMVLMGQATSIAHSTALLAALALATAATCGVLMLSPFVTRFLGKAGLALITKVMGLIVVVIGIQFVIDGVRPVVIDILRAARSSG